MAASELLDLQGIDALLDRFRARRAAQVDLRAAASDYESDLPNVLRPEALKTMGIRFRMVGERMAGDLSAVLRSHMKCRLAEYRQLRLRSVAERLPDRVCIIELQVAELQLPAFLIMQLETATSIIDRLVGGEGACAELERDLTAIEQRVMLDVVRPVIDAYQAILSGVAKLNMSWKRFIGTREEFASYPPTELYLSSHYHTDVEGGLEWKFEFLLPLGELLPAIERSASVPIQRVEVDEDRRRKLKSALCDVDVDVTIELGKTELSLREVATLAPGDVILLDSRPGDDFVFQVGGRPKYRGQIGRSHRSLAFKVGTPIGPKGGAQEKKR
ncbi:MAG: FliM/FliN family flagellar motor switch protein [Planctomycetes bacterium]|nr:FliM/FliN family flagellar motor switch protein [Planctomycetota bacterium]